MTSMVQLEQIAVRHATVGTSSRQISGRPSLILSWQNASGEFQGEACPLPGFGGDSLEAAEDELRVVNAEALEQAHTEVCAAFNEVRQTSAQGEVKEMSSEHALLDGPEHPISVLEAHSGRFRSASARHCFETVIMGAAAGSCGVPAVRLLAATPVADVLKTSVVLDPLAADIVEEVKRSCGRGVSSIKLKCGRDLERECETLVRLASAARQLSELRLRLDVNQGYLPKDCVQLLQAACDLRVDWIEDPTASLSDWGSLGESSGVRLAVDEPLLQVAPSELCDLPAQVVILKPMALGGWSRCLRFAVVARAQKKSISLSHFFDGPVAMDAAISLAFALQSPEFAPGLGRHVALLQHLPKRARGLDGEELRIVDSRA